MSETKMKPDNERKANEFHIWGVHKILDEISEIDSWIIRLIMILLAAITILRSLISIYIFQFQGN